MRMRLPTQIPLTQGITLSKPLQTDSNDQPRDLAFILKDVPPGSWVALSNDRAHVVGVGISMRGAAYQAQLRGEEDPVLIRMPWGDEAIAATAK
jgi:hypothetical protein